MDFKKKLDELKEQFNNSQLVKLEAYIIFELSKDAFVNYDINELAYNYAKQLLGENE